ncbi:SGNH/GDSL hydrolase family protein [Brachybacterium sp. p3-SID957]|uniref:SGNH/GDSL hydrolase family protein n=1 Tax=Brachybacterium sp. p3-SID957 TaxID=2916049 RepID=UPI00223B6879|nr:SGNH/GDSL hydrolase family protein [Brachybacterium sp. p3-SID957]MCT1775815.1 SGNH/GDSL hydrolase family protein [Brachybacterium sp. p3-SID957]
MATASPSPAPPPVPHPADPPADGAASTGAGTAGPGGQALHPWHRFVALGDSFTEGIGDPDPMAPGGHRGWADRVAAELGRTVPDFSYANLAIRGRLYRQILEEQLEPALALDADLISIFAGGNDVIRRGDPDEIASAMDDAVAQLAAGGATVILWTGPDVGDTPVFNLIRGRVAVYNENIRAVARRHGAAVVDLWSLRALTHSVMWAEDRLHFSPTGHQTIAVEVLDTLGVPHELDRIELGDELDEPRPRREARHEDLQWAREHLGPWVVRRIRGVSSGDGIAPKRPQPSPVFGEAMPPGSSAADPVRAAADAVGTAADTVRAAAADALSRDDAASGSSSSSNPAPGTDD